MIVENSTARSASGRINIQLILEARRDLAFVVKYDARELDRGRLFTIVAIVNAAAGNLD